MADEASGRWPIRFFTTRSGRTPVRDAIDDLSEGHQRKVAAWLAMLSREGPDLPRPYADHVQGRLRELRVGFAGVEFRVLYAFRASGHIVLLHAVMKKSRALRRNDIETAAGRLREFEDRIAHGEVRL